MLYKRVNLILLILMGVFSISIFAQSNKSIENSMKTTKPITLSSITIPNEMKEAISQTNQILEIARLKKENVILQLRLLLNIPNSFIYNESNLSFDPPKEEVKEEVKEKSKESPKEVKSK